MKKESLSNRVVNLLRKNKIVDQSLLTALAKLTDGGQPEKWDELEKINDTELEKRILKIFKRE
jgi:hypothetical protein